MIIFHTRILYCVSCGTSSPRKILCARCFEAKEWEPATFCAACGKSHTYEGGLRLFCQVCWSTIRSTLADTMVGASPLSCQDLAQLGYWQISDCCPDCHIGAGEYLHALQLDGNPALLCCCATHAAIRLLSRLTLRFTDVPFEEEREDL